MEVALFNELASTPATLEASRVADMYSCFEGHGVESRDVEQAYLQAEMEGPPVYVVLPEELWTPEMWQIHRKGDTPVVRLKTALYGHKNSGVYWQRFCDSKCLAAGFKPTSENWTSVYFNDESDMLLVVYVDDMKLSGPKCNMEKCWKDLGQGIKLEKPKGDTNPNEHTFLGCIHRRVDRWIDKSGKARRPEGDEKNFIKNGGKILRCMEYDMTATMGRTAEGCQELVHKII